MGTGKPITVHREEPQERKGTRIFSTYKNPNKIKGKGQENSWPLVGYNFVQYFSLRKAENLNAVRTKEKLKQRSVFPTA